MNFTEKFAKARSGMTLHGARQLVEAQECALMVLASDGPIMAERRLIHARKAACDANDTAAQDMFDAALPIAAAHAIVALVDNGAMGASLNQAQEEALASARELIALCQYAESMVADADGPSLEQVEQIGIDAFRGMFGAEKQRPIGFTAAWRD